MRTTAYTASILSLALCVGTAFAGPVTVTNIAAIQRPAEPMVDIHYDLLNPSGGLHNVAIEISTNAGAWYVIWSSAHVDGDIGAGITTGAHKQIVWDAAGDLSNFTSPFARVRVRANDDNLPWRTNGMALIPAGSFRMGTNDLDFESELFDAGPNHTVYVSTFWMDQYEVTSQKWFEVKNWALAHGYAFDNAGAGKGATHPVHSISWDDCVKWCNARSEMEGLTPCYYTNLAQTLVYRRGQEVISNEWVRWTANGYRLPTEAEWEKAARGGARGRRFPWSDVDTIQHARANYNSSRSYAYDTSPTLYYHPTFATGDYPYTSPVGYFAANNYGLYDMAGNVWEWCWDWYDGNWYSNAGATQDDPCGPGSGTGMTSPRILRGGHWYNIESLCRVADRHTAPPYFTYDFVGFRCVRRF